MTHRYKILASFAIVYVVWGSTYLAIRVGVPYMPSALFAGLRFVVAGLVMLLGLAALRRSIRPTRHDLAVLALAAFLLLVMGNGLVVLAETMVPAGPAALVVATVPLWVAALEAVLPGGERLPLRGWAGLALGLGGLAVLTWPQLDGSARQPWQPLGILILLVASLSWAAGTLLMRRRPVRLDPFAATGWEMLLGGVFNLLAGLLLQGAQPITWNATLIGAQAYLIVFGSLVAFSAYVWLVQHVPASKVATYAYINPVVAVLLGAWLLGERVDAYVLGGMAVILLGVALVSGARTGRRPERQVTAAKGRSMRPAELAGD